MGVVYLAEDPRLKRQVASKLLPPDLTRDATAKPRFLREAQAASALDHPNICTIHEIDETADGQFYRALTAQMTEHLAREPRLAFQRCFGLGIALGEVAILEGRQAEGLALIERVVGSPPVLGERDCRNHRGWFRRERVGRPGVRHR